MKRVVLLLATSAVAVSYGHAADDIASVAPDHCKLLKEDSKVRVIHCILKKGDRVGMHSHPPFAVYFIKGGKPRYTLADGTTRDMETKNDEAQILPPVTHSGKQLSDVDEVLVELKQLKKIHYDYIELIALPKKHKARGKFQPPNDTGKDPGLIRGLGLWCAAAVPRASFGSLRTRRFSA